MTSLPSDIGTSAPLDAVAEVAAILAKGYLRLLARKVAPVAEKEPTEGSEITPNGLDDVRHKSVHGAGLTEGAP